MQRRLLVMVAGVGLVVVAGLLGALAGWGRLVDAVLVVLAGVGVVLLLDLRRRAGESTVLFRRAAERDRELSRQVGALARARGAAAPGTSSPGTSSRPVTADLERQVAALGEQLAAVSASLVDAVSEPVQRVLGPDGQVEQMERRVIGSFEAERLQAAERHRELTAAFAQQGELVQSETKRTVDALTTVARDETRQVEALLQIVPGVDRNALLPPSGRWAMDARSIGHLLDIVRARAPRLVVELGGGTSTIWLGYEQRERQGRVVSVDHDPTFAGLTGESVSRHGLDDVVDVRLAELTERPDGASWYDTAVLEDLEGIDLLLVDGPPGHTGQKNRSFALPYFISRLSPDAVVLLDDANRPDEQEIVDEWCREFDLEQVDAGVSRLAVLRPRR